jgi:hypothetical protein
MEGTNKTYDVSQAAKAQGEYCQVKGYPHFAPSSGVCWKCHQNIYKPIEHDQRDWQTHEITGKYITGISVEKASTELVTGCPHCNRSYCD